MTEPMTLPEDRLNALAAVVPFRTKSGGVSEQAWARAWMGILQVLEANGRTKVEISVDDVRRVASLIDRAGLSK